MNQAVGPLLEIETLSVDYGTGERRLRALNSVDLRLDRGEAVGIVGESGSGKSTLAMAVMGLLDGAARIAGGRVMFNGQDFYGLTPESRRRIRGREIGIVFQDPFTSLNPAMTVGRQIAEPLVFHRGLNAAEAGKEARRLLDEVGIADAERMLAAFPHQLSGGMKQRALIATALACDPALLVLDEPTTALDVTIEAQILDLLDDLRRHRQLSILFISHNLDVIARVVDQVCVLYAGDVVEFGPKDAVLRAPRHPYTKGLLASLPRISERRRRLVPIPGRLPDLSHPPTGCIFRERCTFAVEPCTQPQALVDLAGGRAARCWRAEELAGHAWRVADDHAHGPRVHTGASGATVLDAREVSRSFDVLTGPAALRLDFSGGFPVRYDPLRLQAVDQVSLTVAAGETVGLVGESGCGKSTLGRCLIRLIEPQSGTVEIDGRDLLRADRATRRELTRTAQIIFQNPDSSLNPRKTVRQILARPLRLFGLAEPGQIGRQVEDLLDMVQLSKRFADRYPHQMSGGEKQRVGIARALATRPRFVVCDEAVSALDVSVQASILNLLADLQEELGLAYLFISHDLSVVSHIADRICVMYKGGIVETGPVETVLEPPYHPYTEALLSAAPSLDDLDAARRRVRLQGGVGRVTQEITGCRFADRCPHKLGAICDEQSPPQRVIGNGHTLQCHLSIADLRSHLPVLRKIGSADVADVG